MKKITWFIF